MIGTRGSGIAQTFRFDLVQSDEEKRDQQPKRGEQFLMSGPEEGDDGAEEENRRGPEDLKVVVAINPPWLGENVEQEGIEGSEPDAQS